MPVTNSSNHDGYVKFSLTHAMNGTALLAFVSGVQRLTSVDGTNLVKAFIAPSPSTLSTRLRKEKSKLSFTNVDQN